MNWRQVDKLIANCASSYAPKVQSTLCGMNHLILHNVCL